MSAIIKEIEKLCNDFNLIPNIQKPHAKWVIWIYQEKEAIWRGDATRTYQWLLAYRRGFQAGTAYERRGK